MPKAWVGCLACYNEGRLCGAWMDGSEADNRDRFEELVMPGERAAEYPGSTHMHSRDHEELWVMDFEDYHGFLDGECSPMEAAVLARLIESLEDEYYPPEAVAAWCDYTGNRVRSLSDFDNVRSDFEESYNGEWDSEEDFAVNFAEDIGAVNDDLGWPHDCIDWEKATRELFMDFHSSEAPGGKVFVFRVT